jgi:hypothetical protein
LTATALTLLLLSDVTQILPNGAKVHAALSLLWAFSQVLCDKSLPMEMSLYKIDKHSNLSKLISISKIL